jgi:hypothetical protein
VVGENVGKALVVLVSGEGGEIDTSGFECGVGWCEDREWPVTLERLEEPGLDDCIDQRGVNPGRVGICGNVLGLIGRCIERQCGQ